MTINKDTRGFIRYLHFNEEQKISAISKKTGVSRKTVRTILDGKQLQEERMKGSKLDPFITQIQAILAEKPLIPTVLILDKIRASGYDGGRTILYEYVFKLRTKQKPAFVPLEMLPGEQAQVDWGHCGTISCGQHKRKLYVFCMTLSYSRYSYLEFTVSLDMDTFLAAHIHAFDFFQGIPKSILYDNLKSVVSTRISNEITFNARHFDFASFYGFSPRVCNIRKANEKGRVERMIQYIKNNFLNRGPFENFEQIKFEGKNWLLTVANKRLHSVTRKIPEEAFVMEEKPLLLKLPLNGYDYSKPYPLPVTNECLVHFQTNKYSVPSDYAHQTVTLKSTTQEIRIYYDNQMIALHSRCYDKFQLIKNPDHYKALLEKKRRAENSISIVRFSRISAESKAYLSGLIRSQKNVHYHVAKILELCTLFGKTVVSSAIARALQHGAFHWEYIKNIILETNMSSYQPPIATQNKKEIMAMDIEPPDLSKYDQKELDDEQ